MTGKTISQAIGNISDAYLMEAIEGIADPVTEHPGEAIDMRTRKFAVRRAIRIALVACLVLGLGITAYAAGSRILMKLRKTGSGFSIKYDTADDAFIALGAWLPTEVPDGYAVSFVSDPFYGSQSILYQKGDRNTLRFEYAKAGYFDEITVMNVLSQEEVLVHGCAGKLYHQENSQNLFWTNDLEGIGFWLNVDDPALDLLAIAESVQRTDTPPVPTLSEGTAQALEELGDHTPALLPSRYASAAVTGCPRAEGGGWYAYVRKSFTDEAANKSVFLSYKSYRAEDGSALSAQEVLALLNVSGTDVLVNGMPGILVEGTHSVYWVDAENQLKFTLSADAMPADDLLALANSVS